MDRVIILCIEDEREVLDSLVRDLAPFAGTFPIEATQGADEARQVVDEVLAAGDHVGLVLADHLMPGKSGVEFLVELNEDSRTVGTRKVLVTAQAGLDDTIKAINDADLDHYIAKPWKPAELQSVVKRQLTDYVIGHMDNLLPFVKLLNSPRLLEALRGRTSDR